MSILSIFPWENRAHLSALELVRSISRDSRTLSGHEIYTTTLRDMKQGGGPPFKAFSLSLSLSLSPFSFLSLSLPGVVWTKARLPPKIGKKRRNETWETRMFEEKKNPKRENANEGDAKMLLISFAWSFGHEPGNGFPTDITLGVSFFTFARENQLGENFISSTRTAGSEPS